MKSRKTRAKIRAKLAPREKSKICPPRARKKEFLLTSTRARKKKIFPRARPRVKIFCFSRQAAAKHEIPPSAGRGLRQVGPARQNFFSPARGQKSKIFVFHPRTKNAKSEFNLQHAAAAAKNKRFPPAPAPEFQFSPRARKNKFPPARPKIKNV